MSKSIVTESVNGRHGNGTSLLFLGFQMLIQALHWIFNLSCESIRSIEPAAIHIPNPEQLMILSIFFPFSHAFSAEKLP